MIAARVAIPGVDEERLSERRARPVRDSGESCDAWDISVIIAEA